MFKIPDSLAISVQLLPCGTHYALIRFFFSCGGGNRIVPGSFQDSASAALRFGRRHLLRSGRMLQATRSRLSCAVG